MRRGLFAALLAGAAALAFPASAQQRGGAAGDFDFYVLALSWSSGYCAVEGDGKNREQCAAGSGLGFTVHGLWPQNERGYPIECGPAGRNPSRAAIAIARETIPSDGLAYHQWRRHGSCSGASPTDYFRDAKTARERVVIPKDFERPDRDARWSPIDLERAFVAANPGLRSDMIAVSCRRGVLSEVRVCLTKDLRGFRTCEEVDRGGCRNREISVPPVR